MKTRSVIILILELSTFCNLNAMPSSASQKIRNQKMIPAMLYTALSYPQLRIIQIPSKNVVKSENQIGQKIKIKGRCIKFDTPESEVILLLSEAHNIDKDEIKCTKCVMFSEDFKEMSSTSQSSIKEILKNLKEKITDFLSYFDD